MGATVTPTPKNPIPQQYIVVRQKKDGTGPVAKCVMGLNFAQKGNPVLFKGMQAAADHIFKIRSELGMWTHRLGVVKLRQGVREGQPFWLLQNKATLGVEQHRQERKGRRAAAKKAAIAARAKATANT